MKKRVMVVYGTRPEAIKVASVIKRMDESDVLEPIILVTGQHREMMDQVNELFRITPNVDLNLFKHGQTLNALGSRILRQLDGELERDRPDAVLVQGDTTTVAFAAIASFYRDIPVVHVEAGLRSGNLWSPFPEEANRKLAAQVTSLHLAPTQRAKENLLKEGIPAERVVVTGNTVIDALHHIVKRAQPFSDHRLTELAASGRRVILLTTHRRENWGKPLERIARAAARVAELYPDATIVFPVHKNPVIRDVVYPHLEACSNVLLIEPLDYAEFAQLQAISYLILTDSGGVQEEGPSLGKPVLVLRLNTERPEAVEAGTVRLVGTDEDVIVEEVRRLMDDPAHYESMARASNPYGDGRAGERSVAAIAHLLGVGRRMPDFVPKPPLHPRILVPTLAPN